MPISIDHCAVTTAKARKLSISFTIQLHQIQLGALEQHLPDDASGRCVVRLQGIGVCDMIKRASSENVSWYQSLSQGHKSFVSYIAMQFDRI